MYAHIPSFDILTKLAQASSSQRDVMEKDSKKKKQRREIYFLPFSIVPTHSRSPLLIHDRSNSNFLRDDTFRTIPKVLHKRNHGGKKKKKKSAAASWAVSASQCRKLEKAEAGTRESRPIV